MIARQSAVETLVRNPPRKARGNLAALASPFPVVEVYPDGAVMGSRLQDEFCHIPVRVGDDVECNYKDFGVWYPATVTGIDDSGETLQVACARPPPHTCTHAMCALG